MTSRPAPASLLLLVLAFLLAGLVGHTRLATDPLAVDVSAQAVATIASDLPEYSPGETVTLTGSGWTPGETVTIVLHRQPLRAARHRADVGGRRERNDHEHVVYARHPTTSA